MIEKKLLTFLFSFDVFWSIFIFWRNELFFMQEILISIGFIFTLLSKNSFDFSLFEVPLSDRTHQKEGELREKKGERRRGESEEDREREREKKK